MLLIVLCLAAVLVFALPVAAQDNEECFFCHGEPDASATDEQGREISLYTDAAVFEASIHGGGDCIMCHADIEEVPHAEKLAPVNCGDCHVDQAEVYKESLHGVAVDQDDPLAPNCWDCHGTHDIRALVDPASATNPINIPSMCGACHAEDAPVAQSRNIEQHDILQRYEQSIHGEGILRKGLTVTAVCTSCHTAHQVLPHTNPESTIHRDNVVGTCLQCHALIEQVHRKIIEGELWEAEPEKVPICIDCHQPHEARKVFYDEGVSDRDCMLCHAEPVQGGDGVIPAVDAGLLVRSSFEEKPVHSGTRCAQCHTGTTPSLERACETVAATVDCSICHALEVDEHNEGFHGQLLAEGDPDTPTCLDCHIGHGVQSSLDPTSLTFPYNVPDLCGRCHREGEKAAARHQSTEQDVVKNYTMSIHGKGLLKSGLVVTATCADCHTAHKPLPSSDPASSVHRENIPDTCGTCHHGIEEAFSKSIHSPLVSDSDEPLPVCTGCHSAHSIRRTDQSDFRLEVMETCGQCHEDVAETYFDTYHGKVSKLGSAGSAKCHSCHGAHDVLPVTDPRSRLSHANIVETCGECHEGSHRRFAGYLTHATHHDPGKYPALFFSFWIMTALLVGTFAFGGLHTLAWFPQSLREMGRHRKKAADNGERLMFQRFDPVVRQMHFVLILTFFGLALTGMTIKFSYMPWAQWLSKALGGFGATGVIHRASAVLILIVFAVHLAVVLQRKLKNGTTWKDLLTGTATLLPTWNDVREFVQTVKWFFGRGPRPQYGRWTYWEKFDYFAVFWGIAIIGSTGFMLWFPELCTYVLPGWFINVATIIHSDEALLATGFIFTMHFYNTHFRPEKFPMDMVMFTGLVDVEELKREKPRYYEELVASGELEKRLVPQAPKEFRFWAAIFGTLALVIGFSLVVFILWSMIFGYR